MLNRPAPNAREQSNNLLNLNVEARGIGGHPLDAHVVPDRNKLDADLCVRGGGARDGTAVLKDTVLIHSLDGSESTDVVVARGTVVPGDAGNRRREKSEDLSSLTACGLNRALEIQAAGIRAPGGGRVREVEVEKSVAVLASVHPSDGTIVSSSVFGVGVGLMNNLDV